MLLGLTHVNSCSIHSNHPSNPAFLQRYIMSPCERKGISGIHILQISLIPWFSGCFVRISQPKECGRHSLWRLTNHKQASSFIPPPPTAQSPAPPPPPLFEQYERMKMLIGLMGVRRPRRGRLLSPSLLTWNHAGKQEQRWVMKTRVVQPLFLSASVMSLRARPSLK